MISEGIWIAKDSLVIPKKNWKLSERLFLCSYIVVFSDIDFKVEN